MFPREDKRCSIKKRKGFMGKGSGDGVGTEPGGEEDIRDPPAKDRRTKGDPPTKDPTREESQGGGKPSHEGRSTKPLKEGNDNKEANNDEGRKSCVKNEKKKWGRARRNQREGKG